MTRLLGTVVGLWLLFIAGRVVEVSTVVDRVGFVLPQLVSLGCLLLVVRRFEWGDPPMRPWLILTAGPVFLLLSRGASRAAGPGLAVEGPLIVSNVLNVVGMAAMLALVRSSPLVMPLAGRMRGAVWTANILAGAAALAGLGVVVQRLAEVGMADPVEWTRIAAVVLLACDALVFVLAVTLTATVLPMSGGLAARPFLLLAASGYIFLVLDLIGMLVVDGWGYGGFGPALSYTALLAWALFATGALAQAHVLRVAQR